MNIKKTEKNSCKPVKIAETKTINNYHLLLKSYNNERNKMYMGDKRPTLTKVKTKK